MQHQKWLLGEQSWSQNGSHVGFDSVAKLRVHSYNAPSWDQLRAQLVSQLVGSGPELPFFPPVSFKNLGILSLRIKK